MIDPLIETLISLSQAAALFPERRRGKKPHISCLYRWTEAGYKGVVLETVQAGGTRCTSREAVARFLAAITAQVGRSTPPMPPIAPNRSHSAAAAELRRSGFKSVK